MKIDRLLLIAAVIVSLAIQVTLAFRHSLWADEVFSLAMATGHSLEHPAAGAERAQGDFVETPGPVNADALRSYVEFGSEPAGPRQVLRAVARSDTSPPLYYLLLNFWCRLWGTSDLALRSFSMVFMVGCIPWLVALGTALRDLRTGVVAAALFSLAPLVLYYSAEGRMYTLLWFCVLALMTTTLRLQTRPASQLAEAGWCVAAAAGLLVHYYFVFPLAASIGFLAVRPGADRRTRLAVRLIVVGLLVLPWYMHLTEMLGQWRVTQDWVNWQPRGYSRLMVARNLLVQYFTGNGHSLWADHRAAELVALAVLALAAVAPRRVIGATAASRWGVVLLVGWLFAACAGPLVADVVRGSYIAEFPRYASAALPAACLLSAVALARLRPGWLLAGVGLVLLAWSPAIVSFSRARSRCAQPIKDAVRQIDWFRRPNDVVLVHSIPSGAIAIARYQKKPGAIATWVQQLGTRKVPASLPALIDGRTRVVLVKVHTVGAEAPEESWLQANARLVAQKRLGEVYISAFEPVVGDVFAVPPSS